jgi:hypothetical protein
MTTIDATVPAKATRREWVGLVVLVAKPARECF